MEPDSDTQGALEDPKSSKKCSVCGDKALGYNFNAITCESCKAFFRRNALKNKEFNCPFNNNCEVTVITRRFCQKCRLQKCFSIGMKKESILSEEEKMQKWQKIKENRAKKQTRHEPTPHDHDSRPGSAASTPSPGSVSNGNLSKVFGRFHEVETTTTHPVKRKMIKLEDDTLSSDHDTSNTPSVHEGSPQGVLLHGFNPTTTSTNSTFTTTSEFYASNYQQDPSSNISPGLSYDSVPHTSIQTSSPQNLIVNQSDKYGGGYSSLSGHQSLLKYHPSFETNPSAENLMKISAAPPAYLGPSHPPELNSHQLSYISNNSSSLNIPHNHPSNGAHFSQSRCHASVDNLDDVVAIAIKAEFHTNNLDNGGGRDLNEREKARLEELYIASRSLVEPVELERDECSSEPNNLISVINMTDIAIKRIIRMAKKITPFIAMCQEDQIALLKGGCTELMILRSVINYDPDKNSWRLPSKGRPKELRMDVLKEASQLGVNLYEEHQRFVQSFDPKWRSDENVMLLLSAIALFTPERTNVLHKDVVKLEQDTYYYLLRRYLETVCTGCDSRSVYLNLISRLVDLHQLNESHIQLFLEVNPKLVEPLLIEIFDLNPAYR